MGQIEDLRVFVELVNNGGVARGALALNVAKSAASRRLKLLEERYGVQLIDRRPGQWEVTSAGQELYQRALGLIIEADGIESDFTHTRQSLAGPLSVSIPREYGLEMLQPTLVNFAMQHREIQLTIDFDDRRVDLKHENYDIAIRIAPEADPELVHIPLGRTQHRLYAGTQYCKENGIPTTIEMLAQHPLIHFGTARRVIWNFDIIEAEGARRASKLEFQPALNSNNGKFLLESAKAGYGIARMPDFIAAPACASGALQMVMGEIQFHDWAVTLSYSKSRRINRRMRRFIEEITEACAKNTRFDFE